MTFLPGRLALSGSHRRRNTPLDCSKSCTAAATVAGPAIPPLQTDAAAERKTLRPTRPAFEHRGCGEVSPVRLIVLAKPTGPIPFQ